MKMTDSEIEIILGKLPSPFGEMAIDAFRKHAYKKRGEKDVWMSDLVYAIHQIDIVYTSQGCVFWDHVMNEKYQDANDHLAKRNLRPS